MGGKKTRKDDLQIQVGSPVPTLFLPSIDSRLAAERPQIGNGVNSRRRKTGRRRGH